MSYNIILYYVLRVNVFTSILISKQCSLSYNANRMNVKNLDFTTLYIHKVINVGDKVTFFQKVGGKFTFFLKLVVSLLFFKVGG